jgi:hypothetical protein
MRNIAAIKRYRTRKMARLGTKAYYFYRRGKMDKVATIICEEFIELGGVYVKFLQGVMLKSKLMKGWKTNNRLKVFENLDSEHINVHALMKHELGTEVVEQNFRSIQPEPFAAGSFGQVYFAELHDGSQVIVKVLRPMIRELLKYDLTLLNWFSRRFLKLYTSMEVNMGQAVQDFRNATLKETDYIAEAEFAAEMHEAYKDHPTMYIPKTYLDFCSPNIIVQEYVGGISAAQLLALKEQGIDPRQYVWEQLGSDIDVQLESLGVEGLKSIFTMERIQGDPHPGNIRFLSQNKVGLIDFGISAKTPQNKAAFFGLLEEWNRLYSNSQNISKLFEQFMRFFVSDLYRALQRLGSMSATKSNASFTDQVGRVAQESFSNLTGHQDIRPLVEDGRALTIINHMINKNNRFGLIVKVEASDILRAAQTYFALIESFGRRSTVMPKVLNRVVTEIGIEQPEIRHHNEETMSIHDAIETVTSWLERVAERDPNLFAQLVGRIKMKPDVTPPGQHA